MRYPLVVAMVPNFCGAQMALSSLALVAHRDGVNCRRTRRESSGQCCVTCLVFVNLLIYLLISPTSRSVWIRVCCQCPEASLVDSLTPPPPASRHRALPICMRTCSPATATAAAYPAGFLGLRVLLSQRRACTQLHHWPCARTPPAAAFAIPLRLLGYPSSLYVPSPSQPRCVITLMHAPTRSPVCCTANPPDPQRPAASGRQTAHREQQIFTHPFRATMPVASPG